MCRYRDPDVVRATPAPSDGVLPRGHFLSPERRPPAELFRHGLCFVDSHGSSLDEMAGRLLWGTDFSRGAGRVEEYAALLAQTYGATLRLL
jgi:hypothetical protein